MNGNSAQVIGKVNPDHSIKVLTSKDVGQAGEYPHGPPPRLPSQPYSPLPTLVLSLFPSLLAHPLYNERSRN